MRGTSMMFFLAMAVACAQTFEATPRTVPQGYVVRLLAPDQAGTARMDNHTVRLFPQTGGGRGGLMPVPADQPPGDYRIEFLDEAGSVLRTEAITVQDAHFPIQNVVLGKAKSQLRSSPDEIRILSDFRRTISDTRRWAEPFAAPVPGCISSPFGVRRFYNGRPSGNFHSGLDERSPRGRPVRASAAGMVTMVHRFAVLGNTVGIDHGQGLSSMYLHLSRFAVKQGAAVSRGQVIGYVGSTGRSTGPHLHWTIYVNEVSVNPAQWVRLSPCGDATAGPGSPRATRTQSP